MSDFNDELKAFFWKVDIRLRDTPRDTVEKNALNALRQVLIWCREMDL